MAPYGTTPERVGNSETDDVSSIDSLDEPLVIVYRRRELAVADVPERSVEETTANGLERSVEETTANGPERSVEEKKVISSRKRGIEEVIELGKICHSCRNRHIVYLPCSRCPLRFCGRCLKNRHGEAIEVERGENVQWVCPRCRGGCGTGCPMNCCNCSSCRNSQNLEPTGQMFLTARDHGFNNVHDYLIHLETGESAAAIARRKEGRGWTSVDSGILSVAMEPAMEHQKTAAIARRKEGRGWTSVDSGILAVAMEPAMEHQKISPGWEKKKSRSKRWLWKNSKWVKNSKSGNQLEVDPFMISKMRLRLTRYNSSWEIGKKFERKSSDWQKEDEMLSGERMENKFPNFQTGDQVVPQEQRQSFHVSKQTAIRSL